MVCLHVCVCVCLSVGHVREPAKTAEPIDMPFRADSGGPKEPCIRYGFRSPRGRSNFWGCPAYSKALTVSGAVFTIQKDHIKFFSP